MIERLNADFFLMDSGFSNYENTKELARHRWYYYKEGFSPNLVEQAIDRAELRDDDLIIDPFNGSGTTTLTSSILGYKSLGIEVNPFTAFLSKTKSRNVNETNLNLVVEKVVEGMKKGAKSPLIGYSTFTKKAGLEKWLFNESVLSGFEGGWQRTMLITDIGLRSVVQLALISAAMRNCNGTKDGKCLRYRPTWQSYEYNSDSFVTTFKEIIAVIKEDNTSKPINGIPTIINGDARSVLSSDNLNRFKLCVTSPPYLNTFDYTDIYRPELFLGKFVMSGQDLYDLRLRTVRSHIQAKWPDPTVTNFGALYSQAINHVVAHKDSLMHKNIPLMIQAYFEDMANILKLLKAQAAPSAQIWFVVSNSAYANYEIPVDFIIAEIGTRVGWHLKEIGVLRNIKRRKTKHSPDIATLRESVIILKNGR